jgi:actin-related protein 9
MPPFKDEHILLIAPGSQTTLAQLGLPESFTPAALRLPTRMFLAPDEKTYEPYKIRSRKKAISGSDVEMDGMAEEVEEEEFVELPDDDEGAIYPLKGRQTRNWRYPS